MELTRLETGALLLDASTVQFLTGHVTYHALTGPYWADERVAMDELFARRVSCISDSTSSFNDRLIVNGDFVEVFVVSGENCKVSPRNIPIAWAQCQNPAYKLIRQILNVFNASSGRSTCLTHAPNPFCGADCYCTKPPSSPRKPTASSRASARRSYSDKSSHLLRYLPKPRTGA